MTLLSSIDEGSPPLHLVRYEVVTSTNDVARDLAAEGAGPWTVVVGGRQTGGRGRLGRTWDSPAGNLYSTVILRPERAPAEWPSLSLVVALAILDTVRPWTGVHAGRLKWPNDVIVAGAKISGVLLETVTAPNHPQAMLIGTGINIVSSPPEATCLGDHSMNVPGVDDVLRCYLTALGHRVERWERDGFEGCRAEWLDAAAHRGETVLVRNGDHVEEGRLVDLGGDGTLVIEERDGTMRRLTAGDLVLASGG